jgi:hypothetical protein
MAKGNTVPCLDPFIGPAVSWRPTQTRSCNLVSFLERPNGFSNDEPYQLGQKGAPRQETTKILSMVTEGGVRCLSHRLGSARQKDSGNRATRKEEKESERWTVH